VFSGNLAFFMFDFLVERALFLQGFFVYFCGMTLYKTFNYKIPIFYVPLKIVVGMTMRDALKSKVFSKEDREECSDSGALAFTQKDSIYLAIPSADEDIQYVVHEIIHAKNYLYKMRGILPDVENDENEAYLVQYIYEKCIDARRKFFNFVSKQRDNEAIAQQGIGSGGPGSQVEEED
jgi:hypothetical protein